MNNYRKQLKELRTLGTLTNASELKTIVDLQKGSFFKYKRDLYKVLSVATYTEDGDSWYELECYNISDDSKTYFEWEEDDDVEVNVTLSEVNMRSLDKTLDQIEAISEDEHGSVRVNGKTYSYDDDYKAKWRKDDQEFKVYFYDFVNGNEMLTVEEWKVGKGNYEYKAYISKNIYLEDIEVISV